MDRALTMAREMDEPKTETELNTVFELPSGAICVKRPLKSRAYRDLKAKLARTESRDIDSATVELIIKWFEVDGKQLTIDDVDEMSIEDYAVLDAMVNELFINSQSRKKL